MKKILIILLLILLCGCTSSEKNIYLDYINELKGKTYRDVLENISKMLEALKVKYHYTDACYFIDMFSSYLPDNGSEKLDKYFEFHRLYELYFKMLIYCYIRIIIIFFYIIKNFKCYLSCFHILSPYILHRKSPRKSRTISI